MVANINDPSELERFLRDANAAELQAERMRLQSLIANFGDTAPPGLLRKIAARIAYELRFRVPQQV